MTSVFSLYGIRPRQAVELRPSSVEASTDLLGSISTLHYLIAVPCCRQYRRRKLFTTPAIRRSVSMLTIWRIGPLCFINGEMGRIVIVHWSCDVGNTCTGILPSSTRSSASMLQPIQCHWSTWSWRWQLLDGLLIKCSDVHLPFACSLSQPILLLLLLLAVYQFGLHCRPTFH